MPLIDYQVDLKIGIAKEVRDGNRRVVCQLSTGGGKTWVMAATGSGYIQKSGKSVMIVVHREELLHQMRRTAYDYDGTVAFPIMAGLKHVPHEKMYVAMVDTLNNLLKRAPWMTDEIGMVIFDEAHRGEHKKIHKFFPEALLLGFTATPESSSVKDPLKNYFDAIVCGPPIKDLIERGNLVQNVTRHIKGSVNRKDLKISATGDFDTRSMGDEMGKAKHVQNVVDNYRKYADGTKTIVFNCNIEHSLKVHEAFLAAGYPSMHIDSKLCQKDKDYRKKVMEWFANTPGAIMNSVDMTTTGFDRRDVETVIVNRATMSRVLWIQMCGRGGRTFPGKTFFTILDFGSNGKTHGDWHDFVDWYEVFHNPRKPKKDGVAPMKVCKNPYCECLIPVQVTVCPYCGHEMPRDVTEMEEAPPVEMEVLTKGLDVDALISTQKERNYKKYYAFFSIGTTLSSQTRKRVKPEDFTHGLAFKILDEYHRLARDWVHKEGGKNLTAWHKRTAQQHLFKQLNTYYPDANLPIPEDQGNSK